MGVPRFYRWINHRYPNITQSMEIHESFEIDHLYIDMNGIIHSWTHNDTSPCKREESKVFSLIMNNIEVLFDKLRPQKTLFIAVDGVAPQIKMAQQRSRRFQSATFFKKMLAQNKMSREECFDSVNISPGTLFMHRLHVKLKEFIHMKMETDPLWSQIKVIYSGHDCPGEGEHKMREYLSYQKTLPDYMPNERHCFYGMDADLIFLALTTHEKNICILRENVLKISGSSPFFLPRCIIYVSVLRDYIELEFDELKKTIKNFDLEQLIDDWVFLGYLLGNDFLPNLPNMMIHADTFEILWDTYKVVLPQLDGYLCDFGLINFPRFSVFVNELSKFDKEWFRENDMGNKWIESKRAEKLADDLENLGTGIVNPHRMNQSTESDFDYTKEEFEDDQVEFDMFIRDYYQRKFDFNLAGTPSDELNPDVHQIIFHFCKTLQWIMHYYFTSVPDWGYYYPYHYSPFTTDIARYLKQHFVDKTACNCCQLKMDENSDDWCGFEKNSQPISPFELQILIFPENSANIVPQPLRFMLSSDSLINPLYKYFPVEYEVDQNDKKAEYEAVVLIPFMDRKIIEPHYRKALKNVSAKDLERNNHGFYIFYESNTKKVLVKQYDSDFFRLRVLKDVNRMKEIYNLPTRVVVPQFPELKTKPFTYKVSNQKIKLFENWNTTNVMNLTIGVDPDMHAAMNQDMKTFAEFFLGHPQRIRWPHFLTVMPVRIVHNYIVYELKNFNQQVVLDYDRPAVIQMYDLNVDTEKKQWVIDYRKKILELIKIHRGLNVSSNVEEFKTSLVFCRKVGSWTIKSRKHNTGKVVFSIKPEFREYNLNECLDNLPSGVMAKSTEQGDKYVKRSMFDTDFGSINSNVYVDIVEMLQTVSNSREYVSIPLPACVATKNLKNKCPFLGMHMPLSRIFAVKQKVISFHFNNFGSPMEIVNINEDGGYVVAKSAKTEKYRKYVNLSFLKRQAIQEMNEKYYSVYDIFQMTHISRPTIGKFSNLFFIEITADTAELDTPLFVNNKNQDVATTEDDSATPAQPAEKEDTHNDSDGDEEYIPLMKASLSTKKAIEKKSNTKKSTNINNKKNLVNIGLRLRDRRNWDTVGWSRFGKEKWYFSKNFIEFLRNIKSSFPALIDRMDKCQDKYLRDVNLFPKDTKNYMAKLIDFIKTYGPKDPEKRCPEVESVPESFHKQIKTSLVYNFVNVKANPAQNFWRVQPTNVISSMFNGITLNAKLMSGMEISLFTRVVYLKSSGMVPFGLTGTVVTLYKESNTIKMLEVLFDESFEGAKEVKGIGAYYFNVSVDSVVPLLSDEELVKLNLSKLETMPFEDVDLSQCLDSPPEEWLEKDSENKKTNSLIFVPPQARN